MKKLIYTTIEITESHVKVLQAKEIKRKRSLTYCDIRPIPSSQEEDIVKVLSEMTSKIKGTLGYIIAIIPRRLITLVQFYLPTHVEAEIRQMIDLQIVNRVPYAKEDIIFDCQIIEKDESGYSRSLVAVVQNSVIKNYLNRLQMAGIHPVEVAFSSLGIGQWYEYKKNQQKTEIDRPVLIIDLDVDHSDISFYQKNQILFSREVGFGLKDLHTDTINTFIQQIGLTVGTYKKEKMGAAVEAGFVFSSMDIPDFFIDKLKEEHGFSVEKVCSMDNVPYTQDIALARLWENEGVSLSASAGILLGRDEKRNINLIPQKVTDSRQIKEIKKQGLQSVILIGLIIFFSSMALILEGNHKSRHLQYIQDETKKIRPKVKKTKKLKTRLGVLGHTFDGEVLVAEIIKELYALTPKDIAYNSFDLNNKKEIVLEGMAKQAGDINNLQSKLVSSTLFANVNLQYTKKRRTVKGELTYFKMSFNLFSDKKEN
ncbi:hypothetical protein MNBD_UNCLBAC01-981 [hydrothermal vent metagenome]|uniref:Type IV pilus biogenesis protein PilM n=1 Tax=hydrothermal vent metagenome TaxID=652676 RepID=A0A3B1DJ35_9ZZZZ